MNLELFKGLGHKKMIQLSKILMPSVFSRIPVINSIKSLRLYTRNGNATSGPRKNELINQREILYIDEAGVKHGVQSLRDVLSRIDRKAFDLVEVNSEHSPPICKLISKVQTFKRLQSMEEAAVRERYKLREKELRFGTSMAEHDYAIRMRRASEALERAFRVKVVVEPKGVLGREALSKERLWKKIFDEMVGRYGKELSLVSAPQVEFRNLTATLALLGAKPPSFAAKKGEDEVDK